MRTESFDVVVVGSGAAGMCAAIVAHDHGLKVLIVEKTAYVGGTTAMSNGGVWIPMNPLMHRVQQADSRSGVDRYLRQTIGRFADTQLMDAYLTHGPRMVEYLEQHTAVKFAPRAFFPDYYPDVAGASVGGRTLDPLDFDAGELGASFALLRWPRPEFMLFGGMMVNRADIVHLLRGRRSLASMGQAARLLVRHAADRLRYPRGARLVFGNALAGRLFKSVLDRRIPIWLSTRAVSLVRRDGRVAGVEVEQGAKRTCVWAKGGVILASGGCPGSDSMRSQYLPHAGQHHTAAPRSNTGDGAAMALAIGSRLGVDLDDEAFWTPVSLLRKPDGSVEPFPHLVTDRAKPGSIVVNQEGRRYVDESCNYHDFVKAMHVEPTRVPSYLICDARFVDEYGLGFIRPWPLPRARLMNAGYAQRARTIVGLASKIGIDPVTLEQTVDYYNRNAAQGRDPDFSRGGNSYSRLMGDLNVSPNPCIGVINAAPFYALALYPGSIGTARGICTDTTARVLDAADRPVEGLYACGNDMHSVMGGLYPGPGITLGPALTFGFIAAMHVIGAATSAPVRVSVAAPVA